MLSTRYAGDSKIICAPPVLPKESIARVGDIMMRKVVTAHPDIGVDAMARMMLEHRIGAVPVVDGEGRPAGILSEAPVKRLYGSRFGRS